MHKHKWIKQIAWPNLQILVFSKFTNNLPFVKPKLTPLWVRIAGILVSSIALVPCFATNSPDLRLPLSPAQFGLGFIAPMGQIDPLLLPANPVTLAAIPVWAVSSSQTRWYGIRSLSLLAVAGGVRLGPWVIGAGLSQFGGSLYKEQDLIIGFAAPLRESFTYGANVRIHTVTIKNYGAVRGMALDLAWHYNITRHTGLNGSIKNINGGSLEPRSGRLPQVLATGFRWQDRSVTLLAELAKEVTFAPEFRLGVEVDFLAVARIRMGMTHRPPRFGAGFRLKLSSLTLDYGFNHHNSLGYTHILGVVLSR